MKKILTLLLTFSVLCFFSQNKPAVKQNQKKYNSATTNSVNIVRQGTCVDKQFSIVFYVIQNSLAPTQAGYPGIGAATSPTLILLMSALNNAFKPICVSFTNCSTVYIPNFYYGKTWLKNVTEAYVTGSYYTDKTINIYVADTVFSQGFGNTELEGYTYEPSVANLANPKKDLLVIRNSDCLNAGAVLHQLGHYFGLAHTFDEVALPASPPASPGPPSGVVSQEFADGSNCAIHGDRICDTDADPNSGQLTDGMGNYYIPPKDNYMTYYFQNRCRFTTEQYNLMADVIRTKRLYLH